MDPNNISFGLAFLAGLASFLSPCCLSLVPAYIGYLGSRTVTTEGQVVENRWVTVSHGLAFVLGFSVVFVALGLTASVIGAVLFVVKAVLMLVLLPLRLVGFGIRLVLLPVKLALGLLVLPILAIAGILGLGGLLIGGLVALLVPLLPIAFLVLLVWLLVKAMSRPAALVR